MTLQYKIIIAAIAVSFNCNLNESKSEENAKKTNALSLGLLALSMSSNCSIINNNGTGEIIPTITLGGEEKQVNFSASSKKALVLLEIEANQIVQIRSTVTKLDNILSGYINSESCPIKENDFLINNFTIAPFQRTEFLSNSIKITSSTKKKVFLYFGLVNESINNDIFIRKL